MNEKPSMIQILRLPKDNIIVKQEGYRFFVASNNSFIISIQNLLTLIYFLVKNGYVSKEQVMSVLKEE